MSFSDVYEWAKTATEKRGPDSTEKSSGFKNQRVSDRLLNGLFNNHGAAIKELQENYGNILGKGLDEIITTTSGQVVHLGKTYDFGLGTWAENLSLGTTINWKKEVITIDFDVKFHIITITIKKENFTSPIGGFSGGLYGLYSSDTTITDLIGDRQDTLILLPDNPDAGKLFISAGVLQHSDTFGESGFLFGMRFDDTKTNSANDYTKKDIVFKFTIPGGIV
jgi:hypothetical protein